MAPKKKKKVNGVKAIRDKMTDKQRQLVLDLLSAMLTESLVNALPFKRVKAFESNKWIANQGKYWQTVASAIKWAMDRVSPENRTGRPKQCLLESPAHLDNSLGLTVSTKPLTLSPETSREPDYREDLKRHTRRRRRA